MNFVIIDTATDRAIQFTNVAVDYPDCYCIEGDFEPSVIGKKYNNGNWEESSEPFVSDQGRWVASITPSSSYTAERWLDSQGYSSIRLITLLDLENQLASVLGNSPKLTAVRAWINGILAAFVQDPTPKIDWPAAPHTFEETTQEAFALLST